MDGSAEEEPATERPVSKDDEAFSGLPIPSKGTLLLGKYRVEGVVGIGGMGMVIAARHEHLNERVALKLLLPRYAEVADIRKRFQREAQAAYKLRSEHVCRVLDAGDLEDGTPFIAMEFLKGDDLAVVLRKRGRIPAPEAVDFMLQACDALGEAHANEVVHRDLKPSNLVIIARKDGTPCLKLIDFGISKVSNETSDLTNTYGYLGSPSYSAPEQFASTRAMTASGDIWALGVILYEMICGKLPFDFPGDSIAEMATTITHDAPVPMTMRDPTIDPKLDKVVLRCLEKDPAHRHARVRELAEALAPFASAPVDDLLGRLRRHQGGASKSPQKVPERTAASSHSSLAPVVPSSTLPFQEARFEVGAPSPMAMPMLAPSQPPLGPPPMATRYAVVADPPAPAARPALWMPVAIAVIAMVSAFAAVVLYRGARPVKSPSDPAATSASLEPVAMGTTAAVEPAMSTTLLPLVPPVAPSAAPSASAARPTPTARPSSGRPAHHPATAAPAPPASGEGGPKILRDRDGKF